MWTEKILLLLNREEDPTDILTRMNPDDGGGSGNNKDFPITNSVHKVEINIRQIETIILTDQILLKNA